MPDYSHFSSKDLEAMIKDEHLKERCDWATESALQTALEIARKREKEGGTMTKEDQKAAAGLQSMPKEPEILPAKRQAAKPDKYQGETTSTFTKFLHDARALLKSGFLPQSVNDPKIPEDQRLARVCVGMSLAQKFPELHPLQFFQSIYWVGNEVSFKSSFIISMMAARGLRVRYEEDGDWVTAPAEAKTRAYCVDHGMKICSTWITWELVKREKWDSRNGSKWQSMPAQMARYRAAAFLVRGNYPEILHGYYTADERADFVNGEPPPPEIYEGGEIIPDYQPPQSIRQCNEYRYEDGPTAEQWQEARAKL